MGNWGDDIDEEAKTMKEYEGRFTLNFMKINADIIEMTERVMERTETHPRNAILMLWAGAMIGMLIAAVLSFQVLAFFLIVIIFFYFLSLWKLYKCWKHFKYSSGFYWGITIPAIAAIFVIAHFAHAFMEMMLP